MLYAKILFECSIKLLTFFYENNDVKCSCYWFVIKRILEDDDFIYDYNENKFEINLFLFDKQNNLIAQGIVQKIKPNA